MYRFFDIRRDEFRSRGRPPFIFSMIEGACPIAQKNVELGFDTVS